VQDETCTDMSYYNQNTVTSFREFHSHITYYSVFSIKNSV